MTVLTKAGLRAALRAGRESLDPAERAAASERIQRRILALPAWRQAREVLLYAAFRGEVDTSLLLDDALDRGVRVLLPRCRIDCPGEMELAPLAHRRELAPGSFNIPEPNPAVCFADTSCRPELAVIPAIAYDRFGYRLGYGGGYYDRMLNHERLATTLCIGLAYAFQTLADPLPIDPWDKPVHAVCNEEEMLWVSA